LEPDDFRRVSGRGVLISGEIHPASCVADEMDRCVWNIITEHIGYRPADTAFPASCGSGGQFGSSNSTSDVSKLHETVARQLGFNIADAVLAGGQASSGARSVP
jgi:hypothetical protein